MNGQPSHSQAQDFPNASLPTNLIDGHSPPSLPQGKDFNSEVSLRQVLHSILLDTNKIRFVLSKRPSPETVLPSYRSNVCYPRT